MPGSRENVSQAFDLRAAMLVDVFGGKSYDRAREMDAGAVEDQAVIGPSRSSTSSTMRCTVSTCVISHAQYTWTIPCPASARRVACTAGIFTW